MLEIAASPITDVSSYQNTITGTYMYVHRQNAQMVQTFTGHDFLLVFFSDFGSIRNRCSVISRQQTTMPQQQDEEKAANQ